MNIKDVRGDQIPIPEEPKDLLRDIFAHQLDLMKAYQKIEDIPDWPLPFQDKTSQVWFKNFMWRAHEELAEAEEALSFCYLEEPQMCLEHVTHFFEELSDALHFMVELMILADINPIIPEYEEDVLLYSCIAADGVGHSLKNLGDLFFGNAPSVFFDEKGDLRTELDEREKRAVLEEISLATFWSRVVSYRLGLAGNVLKYKQWKQTAVMSDKDAFDAKVKYALQGFFGILIEAGFTAQDIYVLYMVKKQVNAWRQNTNY